MRKVVLAMKSNKVVWNPMEPMNFVLANEDHNLYTFDMRKMEKALLIHKDHVSAVTDVAFSPTGKEFVSGSYDRTIRIFGTTAPRYIYAIHSHAMHTNLLQIILRIHIFIGAASCTILKECSEFSQSTIRPILGS